MAPYRTACRHAGFHFTIRSVLHVFSCESPIVLMAAFPHSYYVLCYFSVDVLRHLEISLGKVNILVRYRCELLFVLPPFGKLGLSAACVTSSRLNSSVICVPCFFSTDTAVWLTSVIPHGKATLPHLLGSVTTPALKDFQPVWNDIFLVYITFNGTTMLYNRISSWYWFTGLARIKLCA